MKLDERTLYDFVQQAKIALTKEDESILAVSGSACSWAWAHMTRPHGGYGEGFDMDWVEFSAYSDAVGDELVVQGILKVDRRKKRGLTGHNPLRLRLSKKWYNENRKGEDK